MSERGSFSTKLGYPRHVRSTPLVIELRTFQIDSVVPNSEVAALTQSGLTYRYEHAGPDCWWTSNSGILAGAQELVPHAASFCFFHPQRAPSPAQLRAPDGLRGRPANRASAWIIPPPLRTRQAL